MTARTPRSKRTLGRPVARRAGAVLLARNHDERSAVGLVLHRRVEDARLLVGRQVARDASLGARRQEIAKPNVRKCAAHHDLVVAAAAAVAVEVARGHAVLRADTWRRGRRAQLRRQARYGPSSPNRRAGKARGHPRCPSGGSGSPALDPIEERRQSNVSRRRDPSGSGPPARSSPLATAEAHRERPRNVRRNGPS